VFMKRVFAVACMVMVALGLAAIAGAREHPFGSANLFVKLSPSPEEKDLGTGSGLTKTGPFSKQRITAYRCESAGNPAVSVDMSCNDHEPYGQDWNPDNEIAVAVDPEDPDHLLAGW